MNDNSISINGNLNNTQIQQNTINSSQIQHNSFDYAYALDLINKIKENIDDLSINDELKTQLIDCTLITENMIKKKENPKTIKEKMIHIRDILKGAASSLIATGIISSINSFIGV